MSAKPPFVRRHQNKDGSADYQLVRGAHRVTRGDGFSWDRETTAAFSAAEWDAIERAVLAKFGLARDHDVARREVADPPPLLAHGAEWITGTGGDDVSPR